MADSESDLETDGLELALETLCKRHCSDESSPRSKNYCSEFCELVEEYTGHWQVPLPQLKVLWTALCSFTKATAAFPDDCQHVHYVLSSLALSFFELMLFFSKEEFVEKPLKDILDSFQECHSQLLRHRNIYLQHVKQIIKAGGPWENPVLQGILKEADLPPKQVEDYLSSELPIFFELRVRYLQACERIQEAKALSKSCLENCEAGKHLYFHQAYLTCLCKASLHEHLHKEMAEIDGRDAVEIICNTESVEKDELLLSLCKAFLTQQLHNGDMYYIWDLVFIWSRLHLRAHPSRQGFLAECLQLASSSTNVRAIFPFIKLVTTELGGEGVHVCVELCARALQLCDMQADSGARSLVCKTIAFLLPHDLEICRACALLVFCQERSLEAYRTVCLLYMHPDQEPHPHNSPVRTSVRFHILQMLKERLCFDPEFWNLLTLRTHCLELISDKVMKAAVLSEMREEEEKEYSKELFIDNCLNDSCRQGCNSCKYTEVTLEKQDLPKKKTIDGAKSPSNNALLRRRKWRRGLGRRKQSKSVDEVDLGDDPEIIFNVKSTSFSSKPMYSLRRNHTKVENPAPVKPPLTRKREYLSRCVKSQILKRKGQKKRWLQGLPRLELVHTHKEKKVKVKGTKQGRKASLKLELSYPDNEMSIPVEDFGLEDITDAEDRKQDMPHLENELKQERKRMEDQLEQMITDMDKKADMPHLENELKQERDEMENQLERMITDMEDKKADMPHLENELQQENGLEEHMDMVSSSSNGAQTQEDSQIQIGSKLCEGPVTEPQATVPAVPADPELDGPPLELFECPVDLFHSYSLKYKMPDSEKRPLPESKVSDELNDDIEQEPQSTAETDVSKTVLVKKTWRDRALRTQKYAHLMHHCKVCRKDYKGLNVMRHALSHLRGRKLRCILCGKRFKHLHFAKKHILDHIDEMSKQTPPDKELCIVDVPAANGIVDKVENPSQPQDANKTSNEEALNKKPGSRPKLSSLKREDRIIRNLRTLIKKTSVLHNKCKNPDANIFKEVDFKDEQVVIKDGLVIVRDPSVVEKDGEGGGMEKPAGENGYGVDITYHLCPSESCDRVFLRISSTLTKHAIKCHVSDDKVLEKTFVWAKQKCTLCLRQLQFLQHYKDHMKRHDTPLQYFCYHLECNQRFATQQELKDHVSAHQPFRPQCPFTDCEKLFSNLQGLYDHEWRHYVPAPQRDELELRQSREQKQNTEAPWKQKIKVEEIWLQSKKGQREELVLDHVEASNLEDFNEITTEDQPCKTNDHVEGSNNEDCVNQDLSKIDSCSDKTGSHEPTEENKSAVNGYENETRNQVSQGKISTSRTGDSAANQSKCRRKKAPVVYDPLNVRDLEDLSTLAEGVQQKLGEPHITEHKSFQPEDPSYATFVKAPFIRPPPSTYMDESLLSMRKRRSTEEAPQKKNVYWSSIKKETEQQKNDEPTEQKTRVRCDKCLSSFSSAEELQKHRALNTCSALFGFDSDDES